MNATIQERLLDLFHQGIEDSDRIPDDGARFDPRASFPGHLGLHSMRERVATLGGTFQIESTAGAGMRVCVSIPT